MSDTRSRGGEPYMVHRGYVVVLVTSDRRDTGYRPASTNGLALSPDQIVT